MNKYTGKLLTVYITPTGVRVCEGENRNGNPDISKFFVVPGVESYFATAYGQSPEIVNMSGLVSAIADECKARHVAARRVMVCSDCFGIETEVKLDSVSGGVGKLLSGDIKDLFRKGGTKDPLPPGMLECSADWGETTIDGNVHHVSTRSMGEKYLLKSLAQEFYNHGYEVIFVSGSQEVLLNFRQTEPASFDSQGKIIFNFDISCRMSVFSKDVLVNMTTMPMLDEMQLPERLMTMVREAQRYTGRNPRIYLAGSVFGNTRLYNDFISLLAQEDLTVYDLFNAPDVPNDYEELLMSGEIDPIMTPDYSTNIAMFMASYCKPLITLTPVAELNDVFKKNGKSLAIVCLVLSGALLAGSIALTGVRFYHRSVMRDAPSNLSNLQNQLTTLKTRQQVLNSTLTTLTQADTTVLKLIKFIDSYQTDRVSVVSIDTRDMLPNSVSVDMSAVGVTTPNEVSGGTADLAPAANRENIIIRGYAKTGPEAVSYFNRLFNYGLPCDPVLNGVERYVLPDGDEVYIFEIEIGGVTNE